MDPRCDPERFREQVSRTRRQFLATSASGLGKLALASLLHRDGLLVQAALGGASAQTPEQLRSHFAPKAKAWLFFFMEGAPSQMDLFDPKPKLRELHGQMLPPSFTDKVRFAFIQKESAVLMGSKRTFRKHGQCGMDLAGESRDVLAAYGVEREDLPIKADRGGGPGRTVLPPQWVSRSPHWGVVNLEQFVATFG